MDDAYFPLIPNYSIVANIFMRKSYLTLYDSILGFFNQVKSDYFYQMIATNQKVQTIETAIGDSFRLEILLDKSYDRYTR